MSQSANGARAIRNCRELYFVPSARPMKAPDSVTASVGRVSNSSTRVMTASVWKKALETSFFVSGAIAITAGAQSTRSPAISAAAGRAPSRRATATAMTAIPRAKATFSSWATRTSPVDRRDAETSAS